MNYINKFDEFDNVNENTHYYKVNKEDILEIDLLLNNSTMEEKIGYIKALLSEHSSYRKNRSNFTSRIDKLATSQKDTDRLLNDVKNYFFDNDSKKLYLEPIEDGYFKISEK